MASQEVDDAVGEAPPRDVAKELTAKRQELANAEATLLAAEAGLDPDAIIKADRRVEALRVIVFRLAKEEALVRDVEAREAAESRILGIRRAYGSLAVTMDADVQRVQQAYTALVEAITTLNQRYVQLDGHRGLRLEAAALVDRFDLADPKLPHVAPPEARDIDLTLPPLLSHARTRPGTEQDEHRLRTRRTYRESSGTDGYAIIERAGLKPWPPLTDRQKADVEARQRQAKEAQRRGAEMASLVESTKTALGTGQSGLSGL